MGLLRSAVKVLRFFVPADGSDRAGYGPFRLPEHHPFHRIGAIHDFYFEEAKNGKKWAQLDDADLKLANGMFHLAMNAPTKTEKLELLCDLCAFWPLARQVGKYIWKGPKQQQGE